MRVKLKELKKLVREEVVRIQEDDETEQTDKLKISVESCIIDAIKDVRHLSTIYKGTSLSKDDFAQLHAHLKSALEIIDMFPSSTKAPSQMAQGQVAPPQAG